MNTMIQHTPAICYGEVLWDVLPTGPQPGGAPLNVAYHLNKLGVQTGIMSRIGDDENGRKLSMLIDGWGIKKQFLQVDKQHPTSQVIASINNGSEVTYEIVFPVAWDFIAESNEVGKQMGPSAYFVYGSLASRNIITRNTLFSLLETDAIKVFDVNMRPPFFDKETLHQLLSSADIIKFNQNELKICREMYNGPGGSEEQQVAFLMNEFNVGEILVTKGESGASYYTKDNAYHLGGNKVEVCDTIGSGDSFLAAFIAGHYLHERPETILKNAAAMGAFIATKKGGCPEYELSEYVRFRNSMFQ